MYTVYRENTDPDSESPESSKGHQKKNSQIWQNRMKYDF